MWGANERLPEKVTPRSLIVSICSMPVIGSGKVGLALFPGRQMIISLVLERLISSLFVADLRLRNDLYCVEWGVKLYSLTCGRPIINVPKFTNSKMGDSCGENCGKIVCILRIAYVGVTRLEVQLS